MYLDYKQARNAAWKALIECDIDHLPVDLNKVALHYNILIVIYSNGVEFPPGAGRLDGDGFSAIVDHMPTIYLNDKIHHRPRRRFTVAHEIGHIVLGHPLDQILHRNSENDTGQFPCETQANIFARDLLMPACILAALGIHTPDEIMQQCDISYTSACIRAERLAMLYARGKFGMHPLERKVMARFSDYIKSMGK